VRIRSLGWRTDLALRRLAGSVVTALEDCLVVRTPSNPGFHWGNFILLPSAPSAEQLPRWLERYAALFPGSGHVAFGVDGTNGQRPDMDPLAAAGFEVEASVVMTATRVNLPPRPNRAAHIRALVSEDDWSASLQLTLDCEEETQDSGFLEFAGRRSAAERSLVTRGHGVWFGAFENGRLRSQLGLVDAGGGLARFQSVETHPDARGRGLAGTLVHDASRYGLGQPGVSTLVMVADPDYSAIRLYRSVGFSDTQTQLQAARH